jgi:hypothetical protein
MGGFGCHLRDHSVFRSRDVTHLVYIFDLDSFFLYLRGLLNENGKIFIEVPDWSILDIHTDPLIFEHLNQFNVFNLVNLMNKNYFQVDALEKREQPLKLGAHI